MADVAWSGHLTWRAPQRELVGDYVERESLIGKPARRELHELFYVDRSLDPIAITIGRYRVPGGFWLEADGGAVTLRQGEFSVTVFGGARSFTNGRDEMVLTRKPVFLPLAGAAVELKGDVEARLAYTYTRDIIVLPGEVTMQPPKQRDQYVDAEVMTQLSDAVSLMASATAGTRYLVTYPTITGQVSGDPTLQTQWFGSQSAYAMVDVRAGAWRVSTSLAASRTLLGQLTDTPAAAAITGSFVDLSTRAIWRQQRTWRTALRYRARVFADGRHAHRTYASVDWRNGIVTAQLGAGADLHAGAVIGSGFINSRTLLARVSAGVKTSSAEASLGVAATSSIGDEITVAPPDDPTGQRNAYTLDARSYSFLHAFATHDEWFAGFDLEVDVRGYGMRGLLQAGWAR